MKGMLWKEKQRKAVGVEIRKVAPKHAVSSKISHSALWTGWSKIKGRKAHSPSSCAVAQCFPWSRDTRCDWLLDLHAAFKAKSRHKKTHNLHYSWGTPAEGHSSAEGSLLPLHPGNLELRQLPSTSFYIKIIKILKLCLYNYRILFFK